MPIEDISNIVRMPRLGKIRLGIKVEHPGKNPYPKALDYFNCPPEVQAEFGDKPKELEIMFPTEDPEQFAQQWLRCYSMTQGLVCIGNGETCRRKLDLATGAMASRDTKQWEWRDNLPCNTQDCPEYTTKRCRRVMNLQFLIPRVPGLGVWQIDTTSFYSIIKLNSMIKLLKAVLGRCSMIPLTLALGPIEVMPPSMSKKTVYIMHIKKDIRLADLAHLAQLPLAKVLIPEPEVAEPPEDLFPSEVLAETLEAAEEPSGFVDEPTVVVVDERANGDIAWRWVSLKLQALGITTLQVAKWWQDNYQMEVTLKDFQKMPPVGRFNSTQLSMFFDYLIDYEQKRKAQGNML